MLAAGLLLGVSTVANAQVSGGDADNVQARVFIPLNVNQIQIVQFGDVFANTIPTLDAEDANGHENVGTGAQNGIFTVTGSPLATVNVTFTTAVSMESEDSGTDLQFNPSVYRTAGNATAADDGTTLVENDTTYDINQGATPGDANDGIDTFFIGGTLTADDGTSAIPLTATGLYQGQFQLTVQYD